MAGVDQAAAKLPVHQQRVDFAQAEIRAELVAGRLSLVEPAAARPGRSDEALDERIAEELELVIHALGLMGDLLADDPILISRHAVQLQSIDLMQQLLGNLARVVASADKPAAVDRITLSDLKARLKRDALDSVND